MHKKKQSIPVNVMANEFGTGIAIERFSIKDLQTFTLDALGEANAAHRHDAHSFFLLESGTVDIEIDFQHYNIKPGSVIYVHPNQVHRTTISENMVVSTWALTNENLNPEYLKLLEGITPAQPLLLTEETFTIISESVSTAIKFAERKSDKLHHSILKDSCNALIALVISQYLASAKSTDKISRFDVVNKLFRELLERHYPTFKRPAEYAGKLNISIPYLNECVKNATGFSVSHHIQQRVILEAKRLLCHSDQSVKEISAALGYYVYTNFLRVF
jgi:AraC family transcriptional activator of pobA